MPLTIPSIAGLSITAPSSGVQAIGGFAVGQVGTGIYSAYTLADGDDFQALDLVSPANPGGAYFTTRASYSGGGNMRAPASGALAPNVYVDPAFTGLSDANRGVPMTWDGLGGVAPHSIISGEGTGAIRLMSGRQSTAEKAKLNAGTNPERTAMIASLGRIVYQAPCIIEARLRYTAVGAAGWHPSFWNYTSQPNQGGTGNEYGFEGSSTAFNAYMDDHTSGSLTVNTGTLQIAGGHDGSWHTHTVLMTTAYWSFLIDGVEVNRIGPGVNFSGSNASSGTYSPQNHALVDFFMLTNPAYNATFLGDVYSASGWLAATSGMTCDCEWWRVWYPTSTGRHFSPQIASSACDQQLTAGQAFSVTIPAAATLWGSAPSAENVIGIQSEAEEPGSDASTGFSTTTGLPTWASYNSGTRVLSGTMPANSGRTHFAVQAQQAGCTSKPYRFRFDVAPVYSGATAVTFNNGAPSSFDLYAAWDCGRLIGTAGGTAGKSLTASGLPTGVTLQSDGTLSGTPTVNGTYTVATTCTNNVGQTSSQNVTVTVQTASGAVAAPAGISSATLVGSWDFNAGNSTLSGSNITNITGSDSTAFALANASTGPVQALVADGNATSRNAAVFTSTSSQYLQVANNLGIGAGGCTVVMIAIATTAGGNSSGASGAFLDIGAGGAAASVSRHVMYQSSSTTGLNFRKIDAGSSSSALQGVAYSNTGVHMIVGRSPATTLGAILNVGTGANITGSATTTGAPTGLTHTTMGAVRAVSAQTNFATIKVFRALVYNGPLTDGEVATILTWAQTNYGVVNA